MTLKKAYVYRITDAKYGHWPDYMHQPGFCIAYDLYYGKAIFAAKLPEDKLEEWGLAYDRETEPEEETANE